MEPVDEQEQQGEPTKNLPTAQNNRAPAAQQQGSPFARMQNDNGLNVGAVSVESERAIAEAQGQMTLAKRFPRILAEAHAEFMDSCKMPAFAASAFYSVPRGNTKVTGPSIRFAEECARCYGNFAYGHRELSRNGEKSEVEVFAWDKQKNNHAVRQLTVMHVLDTRDGARKLRDQKDIDDKIANVASKQVRGRILALLPKSMVEAGIQECRKTIAGANALPISQRVNNMATAFTTYGITVAHIEEYLQHGIDNCTLDELIELTGVYNAIKDGAKAADYFKPREAARPTDAATAAAVAAAAAGAGKTTEAAKSEKPAATQKPEASRTPRPTPTPSPTPTPTPAATQKPAPQAQQGASDGEPDIF